MCPLFSLSEAKLVWKQGANIISKSRFLEFALKFYRPNIIFIWDISLQRITPCSAKRKFIILVKTQTTECLLILSALES